MTQRIDCRNFEDHIHAVMDRREPVLLDLALSEHSNNCARCQSILDAYATIDNAMDALNEERLVSVAAVPQSSQQLSHDRFGIVGLMASIAAVMLVVLNWNSGHDFAPTPMTQLIPANGQTGEAHPGTEFQQSPAAPNPNAIPHAIASTDLATQVELPLAARTGDGSLNHRPAKHTGIVSFHLQEPRIRVVSWDRISSSLDPLTPYTRYSSEIPGVRPLQCGFNATLNLIQESLQPAPTESNADPDLGWMDRVSETVT